MTWEDFIINTAISTLLMTVKNPAKAAHLKAAFTKLRDALNIAFPPTA